ncbi:hypothetical protein Tsubulata_010642 [Turnera subulata]|uniref:Uncharacterized protein n=1 Tax=Turnera subulata TaxID=218843 RepID=A0A9Q0FK95_9ROSI|nr:hypothetical protein Tsubulata_010642 [Turnera subulata]
MGNCLRHQPSTYWGGDDWGSPVPDHFVIRRRAHGDMKEEEEVIMRRSNIEEEEGLLLGEDRYFSSSSSSSSSSSTSKTSSSGSTTEVKIKITKKQLEELLGRVDVKELSVQQVLAQLMNISGGGGFDDQTHPRSWRPNLQSIPE